MVVRRDIITDLGFMASELPGGEELGRGRVQRLRGMTP